MCPKVKAAHCIYKSTLIYRIVFNQFFFRNCSLSDILKIWLLVGGLNWYEILHMKLDLTNHSWYCFIVCIDWQKNIYSKCPDRNVIREWEKRGISNISKGSCMLLGLSISFQIDCVKKILLRVKAFMMKQC